MTLIIVYCIVLYTDKLCPTTYLITYYLVHCFWMIFVVVCATMFLFVKVFFVSLPGD